MNWHYRCPKCSAWGYVKWEEREKSYTCHGCKHSHYPPSPSVQHDAYVDTHEWPLEMEQNVYSIKGTKCTVPGCSKRAGTLDHRIAWSKGGNTSVDNLFPMCEEHNNSKGDSDYQPWLYTLGFQ